MSENSVKEVISEVIGNTIGSYEIKTIKRYFKSDFRYKATFAITAVEIPTTALDALSSHIKEGGAAFSLYKTEFQDPQIGTNEVLYITANIDTDTTI